MKHDPTQTGDSSLPATDVHKSTTDLPVMSLVDTQNNLQNRDRLGGTQSRILTPCLTIIYHEELGRVGDRFLLQDVLMGRAVEICRTTPNFSPVEGANSPALPIADTSVSRRPFVLSKREDCIRLERGEFRSEIEVNGHPVGDHIDLTLDMLEEGVVILLARRVVLLLHMHELATQPLPTMSNEASLGIIGHNPAIHKLKQHLRNVARHDVPVLLRGESGTGKELAAAAIHQLSPRKDRPFLSINMGALPPSLASTELFGANRGAYTGATQAQEGYFRKANHGTLFLDEIGDTPLEIQVALLRVLETKEVIALGAQKPYRVDTRIIAATDADLDAQMASGTFRTQLMHRLAGYEVWLPPLRRRRDDLGHLLLFFLRQEIEKKGESYRLEADIANWLPAKVVAQMAVYHWPGNVRELKNVVDQLLIYNTENKVIKLPDNLRTRFRKNRSQEVSAVVEVPSQGSPRSESNPSHRKPSTISDEELAEVYKAHRYEIVATAKALGVSRSSLYHRIQASPSLRLATELTAEEIRNAYGECDGNLDKMVDRLCVSKTALRRRLGELQLPLRSD